MMENVTLSDSIVPGLIVPCEHTVLTQFGCIDLIITLLHILSLALSTILENTAFLGDIVLRLPDIAHELLDNNDDWKQLIQWAIDFTNDTRIFVGKDQQLISMVGYPACMLSC